MINTKDLELFVQLSIFGSYLISGDRYTTPITKMKLKELVVNVTTTHLLTVLILLLGQIIKLNMAEHSYDICYYFL